MADISVKDLAVSINITAEKVLTQMAAAGLPHQTAEEPVSSEQKEILLAHLRKSHGENEPKKITLKRKETSKLKTGAKQTVNVEVRKKKTYVQKSAITGVVSKTRDEEDARLAAAQIKAVEEKAQREAALKAKNEENAKAKIEADARLDAARAAEQPLSVASDAGSLDQADVKPAPKTEVRKPKVHLDADKDKDPKAHRKAAGKVKLKSKEPVRAERKGSRTQQILGMMDESESGRRSGRRGGKNKRDHQFEKPTAPVVREVEMGESIVLQELASKMSVKAAEVVKILFKMGVMATINQPLDQDTAILVIEEMGHKFRIVDDNAMETSVIDVKYDGERQTRAPVVTVMGHVDHGKTSLLDHIRRTRVASGEHGGITQHIGAYHVETEKGMISFLDTPGHAAFTEMRARGAQCTDVVILVVAADDGVMPQTEEAILHAKAAGVPIVVAINKMDKESANPERVISELSQRDLLAEAWGGDVQMVPVSAHSGMGIDALLDAVLLQAEVLELTAYFEGPAKGVVVEASLDKGRGAVATVLVQQGELRKGDVVLAGQCWGRVRALVDETGRSIDRAGPSIPVEIIGLDGTPSAGDDFMVVGSDRKAREVADMRRVRSKEAEVARQQASKLDNMMSNMSQGSLQTLNVVLKTDVRGSLEALQNALVKLSTSEVKVNVVYGGVGAISESDVNLAITSGAVIFGFNTRASGKSRELIEKHGLDLRYYNVIYNLIDDVKAAMSGMLSPELRENILGLAEVRDVFNSPKFGQVAGCMVTEGVVHRNKKIRVLRQDVVIYEGELESLRRFKDDVQDVRQGMECGIGVKNYNDVRVGDVIEVFAVTEHARTID